MSDKKEEKKDGDVTEVGPPTVSKPDEGSDKKSTTVPKKSVSK